VIVLKSLILKDISPNKNRQLKQVMVELMLFIIKLAMGLKSFLAKVIPALFLPLFLLFKVLLYRPFVKLYFLIFKIKKYDLGKQTKSELLRKKSFHLAAIIFVSVALIFNIQSKKPASAALGKQKNSVMEELVKNEFNDLGQNNEELIQETAQTVNWDAIGINTYFSKDDHIIAPRGIGVQEEEKAESENNENYLAKNDLEDVMTKPKQIIGDIQETPTQVAITTNDERKEIIEYTVTSGDTISTIARRFKLNVNTILWANNLTAFSIIRPGNTLSILPTDGFLYKVKSGDTIGRLAQTYDTSAEKIITSNNLGSAGSIRIGQELIIPGTRVSAPVRTTSVAKTPTPSALSGANVIKEIVSAETPIVSSNKMVWPTTGHRITQYFSWSHNGLDIADKVGTPIYAADAGTVEISQGGWNGGYGNTIVVNHGGGKKTRYGHASKLLVSKGDEVEKGQLIALMGSTGRSTGSHLHFEVVINGTRYNPLNYIR
jgi:LysM repeat protein